MLDLAMKIAGIVFTFGLSFLIVTTAIFNIREKLELISERRRREALKEARHEIGQRLINDSYWMSQNKEAFKIMYMLGKELCCRGDYSIEDFRKKVEETSTDTFSP